MPNPPEPTAPSGEEQTDVLADPAAYLRTTNLSDAAALEWALSRLSALHTELERTRRDTERLDAIERGDVEIQSMGTTHKYQIVDSAAGTFAANASEAQPVTLREAIDRALGSPDATTRREG